MQQKYINFETCKKKMHFFLKKISFNALFLRCYRKMDGLKALKSYVLSPKSTIKTYSI